MNAVVAASGVGGLAVAVAMHRPCDDTRPRAGRMPGHRARRSGCDIGQPARPVPDLPSPGFDCAGYAR